jgi:rod shape-determining protein MreC
MLRFLFARRADWAVFTTACALSLTLMLLGRGEQARAAWFIQHQVLAPVGAVVGFWDRGVGVYWENQKLRKRLAQLQIEADALRAERLENSRLRRLLSIAQQSPSDFIPARVIGRSLDRLGGSLTLDKGTEDGIQPDVAVLTPDGLVGRVDRATAHQARVLTLLHRECAVAVRVDRSRVDGVLQWEFGEQPVLNLLYVSSQEDVRVGDLVMTSGLGGLFPPGVRAGTVTRLGLAENGLMKELAVRPAVNFRSVEEVLVFLPGEAGRGPVLPPALTPAVEEAETGLGALAAPGAPADTTKGLGPR